MKQAISKAHFEDYILSEIESAGRSRRTGSRTFSVLAAGFIMAAMTCGVLLGRVEISGIQTIARLRKLDISFTMAEKKRPAPVKKKIVKPKRAPAPVKNPSFKQEVKAADKLAVRKPVRKIYGVRKVYSRGLGSGYGGSDAVVAKLGNSLQVAPDTIKADREDLKGELVSVTRISAMPKIIKSAKPEYTSEMKDNKIIGKVRAKVLVDVDGMAKQIIILAHLGFGTKDSSIQAIRKMKFKPGVKGKQAVAVWIPLTFRFELQA
jgi:hypothetical protein